MIEKLENRAWKVLKSENILNLGPWLNVRQELVELPSGAQIPTWFVLDFPNWINVIAITKDGDFVMEDQYRHALGETHYELVAGVIDPGETPLEAAQRELSEETGFGGGEWQLFMTLSPNPTNHNNLSGDGSRENRRTTSREDRGYSCACPEARGGEATAARGRNHTSATCRSIMEILRPYLTPTFDINPQKTCNYLHN